MNIKVINRSDNPMPAYETIHAAGMDIRASVNEELCIKPFQRVLIPTGLYIELPESYEAQIRPRSGLALKNGITVLNSPGTIDADYRGEVKILLINLSDTDFTIKNGDRIAQMIIAKHERAEWVHVEVLNETTRGTGGYGHTGV
ncbi:dUTP diphosphatase [Arcticibacter tournemirensis]|uniref:Deoxyuridine 5'-triphosphate nucleotidohydrolase n=1 Tax=Arcticibacter tournemirensis TaxID=699437 RepID=A0A4Q0M8V2_9SPHI|nr:dUTP diphosphatase [Arcticibacter tournemirensis]RXF69156.1 dUTP diphosphatase [Arcticibacter tournemirensis]